jgi:hypothetical protein
VPWISSTGTGRDGRHGGSARYPPATAAIPASWSDSSQPRRAVIPPPFDTPVTNTRDEFTHATRSSCISERSIASTSLPAPGTEPLMFQKAFGPPAEG